MKKRIAIITAGWNREYLNFMVKGIYQKASEESSDVFLFHCYGDSNDENLFSVGEYNMFSLPDISRFDGIIYFPNNFTSDKMKQFLEKKFREFKMPVISVERHLEGMDFIGIDNYVALHEMVEHLITHHQVKTFQFLGGPEGYFESEERERAFVNALKEHQIPCTPEMIRPTYYTHLEAYKIVSDRILSGLPIPQAYVCANDDLAIGVCEAMADFGLRVPEDVLVTGFDNFQASANYSPRISTVDRAKEELGYAACEHLFHRIMGKTTKTEIYLNPKTIFSESCGCYEPSIVNNALFRKQSFRKEAIRSTLDGSLRRMTDDLVDCDSYHVLRKKLVTYLEDFRIPVFYLMINQEEYDLSAESTAAYRKEGYSDILSVVCSIQNKESSSHFQMPKEDLFPGAFTDSPSGNLYLFSPVHFLDRSIGYCVIQNSTYLLDNFFLYTWLVSLNNVIENIRQKRLLNAVNEKLHTLYMKDFLTDLFNRFGYEKKAVDLFKKNQSESKATFIIFIDMDQLKVINDNFGHNHGDLAIITLANALKKYAPEEALPIRFGGDEFLLIGTYQGPSHLETIISRIQSELIEKCSLANLPYHYGISYGISIAPSETKEGLDFFIEKADSEMYLQKQLKRKNNYRS